MTRSSPSRFQTAILHATLAAILLPTIHGAPIDFSGYVVDTFCWDKPAFKSFPAHTAPPAGCIDLTVSPQLHTMECIRDVPVCLNEMVMLDQDTTTNRYSKKYTFDAAATLSLQQLICDQQGDVTDSSKLLSSTSCNPGAPDKSIANGGHALAKIRVVGESSTSGVISNAVFNIDGQPSVVYPKTTSPPFKLGGSAGLPKCPTKSSGGGGGGTSSFSSPDGRWTATVTALTDTTVSWKVTHDCEDKGETGWFAFGVSKDGTMHSSGDGSDIVVCSSNEADSTTKASRYWVTSKSAPRNGVPLTDMSCAWAMGKGVLEFTRTLKAGNGKERTIESTGLTNYLWAYGTSNTVAYHGGNKGTVSYDVSTGGAGSSTIPVPTLVAFHAVLMLLSWGFMLPLGAMVARCCKKEIKMLSTGPFWFVVHRRLQITGWCLQLVGFICIAIYKGDQQFIGAGQTHMWVGLVVVILGTLNPIVAAIRPHPTDDNGVATTARKMWEIVHKYCIGWTAVALGVVNCIVAVIMLHSTAYTFDAWLGILAAIFLGVLPGGCIIVLVVWQFNGCKTKILSFTNLSITECVVEPIDNDAASSTDSSA